MEGEDLSPFPLTWGFHTPILCIQLCCVFVCSLFIGSTVVGTSCLQLSPAVCYEYVAFSTQFFDFSSVNNYVFLCLVFYIFIPCFNPDSLLVIYMYVQIHQFRLDISPRAFSAAPPGMVPCLSSLTTAALQSSRTSLLSIPWFPSTPHPPRLLFLILSPCFGQAHHSVVSWEDCVGGKLFDMVVYKYIYSSFRILDWK